MNKRIGLALVSLGAALGLGRCTEVAPSNPFDPQTPAAQQAKGRIEGSLALPEGFDRVRLESGHVELRLTRATGDAGSLDREAEIAEDGTFAFADVAAGTYLVEVVVPGFVALSVTVIVDIAETIVLPPIGLVPDESAQGEIVGTVELEGASEEGHGRIRVAVADTIWLTHTEADGTFRLIVPAGRYRLEISHPGYGTEWVDELRVTAGEETPLPGKVVLAGQPCRVRGTVALAVGFVDRDRLVATDVQVLGDPEAAPIDTATPNDAGFFLFDDLPAGTWTLHLECEGFVPVGQPLQLEPGADVDVGRIVLLPIEDELGILFGAAQLHGAPDDGHGGILVEVEGTPWRQLTGAFGDYRFELPGAEYALGFRHAGYDPDRLPGLLVVAGDETEVEEVVVLVGQPGDIRGTVVVPADFDTPALMEEVSVALFATSDGEDAEPTKTGEPDSDGRFLLESVGAGDWRLEVRLAGFQPAVQSVRVTVGATVDVGRVVLDPIEDETSITGQARLEYVDDPEGHGGIWVETANEPYATRTMSDGSFRLAVAPNRQYSLRLSRPGYDTTPAQRPLGPLAAGQAHAVPEPVILRAQSARVRGTVSLPGGFAARRLDNANATLHALEALPDADAPCAGQGEAVGQPVGPRNGQIELHVDVPGAYCVEIRAAGFETWSAALAVGPGELLTLPHAALVLGESYEVTGVVELEAAGQNAHGGISVRTLDTPFVAETRPDGRFTVQVLPGDNTLRFGRARCHGPDQSVNSVDEPVETLAASASLQCDPGLVQGTAVLPAGYTTLALDDARLWLQPGDMGDAVPADDTGYFELDDVGPGDWTLAVLLRGCEGPARALHMEPGGAVDVGAVLLRAVVDAAIEGTVTLSGAGPDENGGILVEALGTPLATLTEEAGDFVLAVNAGEHTLRFSRPGYVEQRTEDPIRVLPGPPAPLQRTLLEALPSEITGTVTLPDGFDAAWLPEPEVTLRRLEVRPGEPSCETPSVADFDAAPVEDGHFELDVRVPGDHCVEIALDGFEVWSIARYVGPDETVTLPPARLELGAPVFAAGIVEIQDAGDQAHGNISVRTEHTRFEDQSDPNGAFKIRILPSSTTLLFERTGCWSTTAPIGERATLTCDAGVVQGTVGIPTGFTTVGPGDGQVALRAGDRQIAAVPLASGDFEHVSVGPGTWRLTTRYTGFTSPERRVHIEPGGAVDVGVVLLQPVVDASLAGRVTLADAGEGGHGGTRVEAVGTPFSTETDDDGTYHLDVNAGDHTLRFSRPGYPARESDRVRVEPGATDVPVDEVPLQGEDGAVRGTVALPPGLGFDDPGRPVVIELVAGDPEALPPAPLNPQANGLFVFDEVLPGEWRLEIARSGCIRAVVHIVVPAAATVDVGRVGLELEDYEEGERTWVRGTAQLQYAESHRGIHVTAKNMVFSAETDLNGAFRIQVLPGLVELVFGRTGYHGIEVRLDDVAEGASLEIADVVWLNAQPGRIRGTVLLPDGFTSALLRDVGITLRRLDALPQAGQPCARQGVWVADFDLPARSSEVDFLIARPGHYCVEIRLRGFDVWSAAVSTDPGETVALPPALLTLADPPYVASGTVRLNGAGNNAHADIVVRTTGTPFDTQTAADGAFEIRVLPGENTLGITRAGCAGYPHGIVDVDVNDFELGQLPLLDCDFGEIRGVAVLPDGFAAVRSQDVALHLRATGLSHDTQADDAGFFTFDAVGPGDWTLSAGLTGFEAPERPVHVEPGQSVEVGTVLLRARVTRAIRGQVTLQGPGTGLDSVQVEALYTPFVTVTNETGHYTLPVNAGTFSLEFSRPGYRAQTWLVPVADQDVTRDVALVGEPGAIRGTVALPPGFDLDEPETPLVRLYPRHAGDGADPTAEMRTDADGLFLIPSVAAGEWRLEIARDDEETPFETAVVPVSVPVGATVDVGRIRLELNVDDAAQLATVQGTVLLQGKADGQHGGTVVEVAHTPFASVTTSNGEFSVQALPGDVTLLFQHDGYIPQTSLPFSVEAGTTHNQPDVQLQAQVGSVKGRVRLSRLETAPRLGRVDLALDLVPTGLAPDGQGVFSIPGVVPGNHQLTLEAAGYQTLSVSVAVPPGGTADVGQLTLTHDSDVPAATRLTGHVRLTDRASHAGTTVDVLLGDLLFARTLTNPEGWFDVAASEAEAYHIRVERDGYDAENPNGPFIWHDGSQRFGDHDDQPIDIALSPAEVNATVRVSIAFADSLAWIPDDQKVARVRLVGDSGQQTLDGVTPDQDAVFELHTAGVFEVRVERSGFDGVSYQNVVVDADHLSVERGPAVLHLTDLAAARLSLERLTLDVQALGHNPGDPGLLCATAGAGGVSLAGANLAGTTLQGNFRCADLSNANLANANLTGAQMRDVVLTNANLFGADLKNVDLTGSSLRFASLFGADLGGATLAGTDLSYASLAATSLRNAIFVAQGEPMPAPPCDPEQPRPAVKLTGTLFSQTDLTNAQLPGVYLDGVDLGGARVIGANLEGACLRNAIMSLTDMSGTNLTRSDLRGARLINTILAGTSMRGAILSDASLLSAILEDTELGCLTQTADGECACARPFEDYDAGKPCADPDLDDWDPASCQCRTRLARTNLNGANLVGARLVGADLVDSTLLNIDLGVALSPPGHQPYDCELPDGCTWADREACGTLPHACIVTPTTFLGARLDAAEMSAITLVGVDFRQVRAREANFSNTTFIVSSLSQADLAGSDFRESDLSRNRLDGANLGPFDPGDGEPPRPVRLEGAWLREADLRGANLSGARAEDADLTGADLRGATLAGLDLTNAVAVGADFSDQNLTDLIVNGTDLTRADLSRVVLGNVDITSATLREVRFIKVDLSNYSLTGEDLTGAIFTYATLSGADLTGAILTNARFDHAWLDGADLTGAAVSAADFSNAHLIGAQLSTDFSQALLSDSVVIVETALDATGLVTCEQLKSVCPVTRTCLARTRIGPIGLQSCDLAGWDLRGTEFSGTDLQNADLTGALLAGAYFDNAKLSGTTFGGEVGDITVKLDSNTAAHQANMRGVSLVGATFQGDLSGFDLSGCDLTGAVFWSGAGSQIGGSPGDLDLSNADLTDAVFVVQRFLGVALTGATLVGVSFGTDDATLEALALERLPDLVPGDNQGLTWSAAYNFAGYNLAGARFSRNQASEPADTPHFTGPGGDEMDLVGVDFTGMVFAAEDFTSYNLSDVDFTEADLSLVDGLGAATSLESANFTGAEFGWARDLRAPIVIDANFTGVNLTGFQFPLDLTGVDFTDGNLGEMVFSEHEGGGHYRNRRTVDYANFTRAHIPNCQTLGGAQSALGADFTEFRFSDSDPSGEQIPNRCSFPPDITGAKFVGVDACWPAGGQGVLQNQQYNAVDFTNVRCLGRLLSNRLNGKNAKNANFTNVDFYPPGSQILTFAPRAPVDRFEGANFTGAILRDTTDYCTDGCLHAMVLRNTSFAYVDLSTVKLHSSPVEGADFTGATLSGATWTTPPAPVNGGLSNVVFAGAEIAGLNLSDTSLDGADFSGLDLRDRAGLFNDTNLTGCRFGIYVGQDCVPEGGAPSACDRICPEGFVCAEDPPVHANLSGLSFANSTLVDADFEGADLTGTHFSGANLTRASFTAANLTGADLTLADSLVGADLSGHDWSNADFSRHNWVDGRHLTGVSFANANLVGATGLCHLPDANLSGVDLTGRDFSGCFLRGVNFDNATLRNVTLGCGDRTSATFRGADMTGADLSQNCDQDATYDNAVFEGAVITGASFRGASLIGVGLSGRDLTGVDFTGCDLRDADLTGTTLSDVNFTDAQLAGGTLARVDLRGRNLSILGEHGLFGADLSYAALNGANLVGVNLATINLFGANLADARVCADAQADLGDGWLGEPVWVNGVECSPAHFFNGVQTNIPVADVLDGGFELCWAGHYGDSAPFDNIFAACHGDVLMMTCRPTGADTLVVAAMGERDDVYFDVGPGAAAVHPHNGVNWYFSPSMSWGFAPAGNAVLRGPLRPELGRERRPDVLPHQRCRLVPRRSHSGWTRRTRSATSQLCRPVERPTRSSWWSSKPLRRISPAP